MNAYSPVAYNVTTIKIMYTNPKTYVLDTNVLLSDPRSIYAFQENNIIIPLIVIEELDNHKSRQDEIGKNARDVSRELDKLRCVDGQSLFTGISLPNGGTLKVQKTKSNLIDTLPSDLTINKADNILIAFMIDLRRIDHDAILVSRDINVRLKCDSVEIPSQDYKNLKITNEQSGIYSGVSVLNVSDDKIQSMFDGTLTIDEIDFEIHPNQVVVLKDESKSAIARSVNGKLQKIPNYTKVYGLSPKNKEQNFSLDLLLDPDVKLVTLTGPAGCVVPSTPVRIKLSKMRWNIPVPDDTYLHVASENEKEN